MQETQVWFLGGEDPLEEDMATHSSIPAWGIPCTEEPGGLHFMESQRVGHKWRDWVHTHAQCLMSAKIMCLIWLHFSQATSFRNISENKRILDTPSMSTIDKNQACYFNIFGS